MARPSSAEPGTQWRVGRRLGLVQRPGDVPVWADEQCAQARLVGAGIGQFASHDRQAAGVLLDATGMRLPCLPRWSEQYEHRLGRRLRRQPHSSSCRNYPSDRAHAGQQCPRAVVVSFIARAGLGIGGAEGIGDAPVGGVGLSVDAVGVAGVLEERQRSV
jgi:hypothetical protein